MKDAILIYGVGSLLALIVLGFYTEQDVDEETGEQGGNPTMDLVYWTVFLSWVSVFLGIFLIIYNKVQRKKGKINP